MFHVQLNRRQKVQSMNLTSEEEKNEAENLKNEWNISGISYEDTQ